MLFKPIRPLRRASCGALLLCRSCRDGAWRPKAQIPPSPDRWVTDKAGFLSAGDGRRARSPSSKRYRARRPDTRSSSTSAGRRRDIPIEEFARQGLRSLEGRPQGPGRRPGPLHHGRGPEDPDRGRLRPRGPSSPTSRPAGSSTTSWSRASRAGDHDGAVREAVDAAPRTRSPGDRRPGGGGARPDGAEPEGEDPDRLRHHRRRSSSSSSSSPIPAWPSGCCSTSCRGRPGRGRRRRRRIPAAAAAVRAAAAPRAAGEGEGGRHGVHAPAQADPDYRSGPDPGRDRGRRKRDLGRDPGFGLALSSGAGSGPSPSGRFAG